MAVPLALVVSNLLGSIQKPDLFKYKGLIDAYDHIYNGFLNDVSDVQQVNTLTLCKNILPR